MSGTHFYGRWLGVILCVMAMGITLHAQDAPPIVLVIDTSSTESNLQVRHTAVYSAVEKVVFFMAAYNPVSVVSTCSPIPGTQSPTQDAATLRNALVQMKPCTSFDQAQALQTAVAHLGTETGDILYLVDGQHVVTETSEALRASTAALTPLQDTRSCLYVIPIGDASLSISSPNAVDRDAVQDLVNAAGCGQRYEAQKTPTIASTLLEAALLSQGRKLMMRHGEQLPLFSRATAKMNQPITIGEDIQDLRIDVIWGAGTLEIALQPPAEAAVEPMLVKDDGYQSMALIDPAAGPWNIKLSVTQVPENQVAIVLFSQANRAASAHANAQSTTAATQAPDSNSSSGESSPTADASITLSTPLPSSSDVPTTVMIPISDTMAAPASNASPTPTSIASVSDTLPIAPASNSIGNPFPFIAGFVLLSAIGVFFFWRRHKFQSEAAVGGTLHSRPTSDLPPPNLNAHLPVGDKRRSVQVHAPVPMEAQFGEAFHQFPAVMVFKNGPLSGQVFEVDSSYFVIGRHSASNLRVQDGTVSREHARIIFDNIQNLYLIQNVSQAGTQVNGQYIIQRRPLYSGDLIQVGNIQIHFQLRVHSAI